MGRWLIWSHEHQAWWMPHEAGYTDDVGLAGYYTGADASRICKDALDGWHPKPDGTDALPHEVMVPVDSHSLITAVALATVALISERG